MKVLGITGPSGSGKTTLCALIKENYNSYVIDADIVAKTLSSDPDAEYFKQMVVLFGPKILRPDGRLNRNKMASIIYTDKNKRKKLNALTFKYVVAEITNQVLELKNKDYDYIVIDVPLLYEAKMETICDSVIAVIADDEEKILRICVRDCVTREVAKQRLDIQNSNEFFVKKADYIIHNDKTIDSLKKSLKEIISKI